MFFRKKEECNTITTNNNILIWVIIVLAIIISVMGFFLGKMTSWGTGGVVGNYDDLSIRLIKDARDTTFNPDAILKKFHLLQKQKLKL